MLRLAIKNTNHQITEGKIDHEKISTSFCIEGKEQLILAIKEYCYQAGDYIEFTTDERNGYYVVQIEETLAPSLVYIPEGQWQYAILTTSEEKKAIVETAFTSRRYHLMIRKAYDFEVKNYQNLTFNAYAQKSFTGAYPHALANVETRNEAFFFAKNAIDGKYANRSHGSYPFSSWGINQQATAELVIDFGRLVAIDWLQVLFRGDYPHDSYWDRITIEFSDGETLDMPTTNTLHMQAIRFAPKETTSICLKQLKKVKDDSPFPALTQIEAFVYNL